MTDAPVEIAGFSPTEIDQILLSEGADGLEEGPLEPEPGAAPVARAGDVFQLGVHRIVCGDDVASNLHIYLTLSNLRGVPYKVPFRTGDYHMISWRDNQDENAYCLTWRCSPSG